MGLCGCLKSALVVQAQNRVVIDRAIMLDGGISLLVTFVLLRILIGPDCLESSNHHAGSVVARSPAA